MALPAFAAYIGGSRFKHESAAAWSAPPTGKSTMSIEQFIDYLGVPYKGLNVLENDDLRGGVKSFSNWPTIPQLYVKGEFVGGCDIIREMFQAGELQSLFKEQGIPVKETAQV